MQHESLVYPLPDNVDFADAALLEPLSLTVRSLEHVKPFVGESAVIIGPGTVGPAAPAGAAGRRA